MRKIPILVALLLVVSISSVTSASPSKVSKIEVLSEIAKALGDLGDSIVKITNGIKHIVVTGEEGVSFILAKKTKSQLKELSAISTQFAVSQNIRAVQSIDDYIQYPNPDDWPYVQEKLRNILLSGSELLSEWNKERSDFIVEPSYARLIETLNARVGILEKLSSIEAPLTTKELEALGELNHNYKALVAQFKSAIKELNKYIKNN